MNKVTLTEEHCKQVMNRVLHIGVDVAVDGKRKQFVFHVGENEYQVFHDGQMIMSSQAPEMLLEAYNNL